MLKLLQITVRADLLESVERWAVSGQKTVTK